MGFWGIIKPQDAYTKAKDYLDKALNIDSLLAEAHTSLAMLKAGYEWDWEGADKEYQLAIELNPGKSNIYMYHIAFLASIGRKEETILFASKAVELDPLSPQANLFLGFAYFVVGRFDESINQLTMLQH